MVELVWNFVFVEAKHNVFEFSMGFHNPAQVARKTNTISCESQFSYEIFSVTRRLSETFLVHRSVFQQLTLKN